MKKHIANIYLVLLTIESLLVAGTIYGSRNTSGGLYLGTGFTLKNLSLFGAATASIVLFTGILILGKRKYSLESIIQRYFQRNNRVLISMLILIVILLESSQDVIYVFSETYRSHPIFPYYQKLLISLLPYLVWSILFCLQSLLALYILFPDKLFPKQFEKNIFTHWMILYILLLGVWFGIALTDFGFISGTSDPEVHKQVGRFLPLTKPLPAMQIIILVLLILFSLFLIHKLINSATKKEKSTGQQLIVYIIIWAAALFLWNQVPFESNYIIDIPAVPSGTIYPNSDGFFFDKEAYRLLAGEGFDNDSTHVMYSIFLSILHLLGGNNYQKIIFLQYTILAFIPILLFQLTKEFHSPFAGILIAFLYILRERNGLVLGNELAGPAVNQMLSENLALLGMIGFIFLINKWIQQPEKRKIIPLIAGGVMGVSMLIRAEFAATLIAVGAVSFFLLGQQKRHWFQGVLSIIFIVGCITMPWMARNWKENGYFSLDKGNFISRRVSAYIDNSYSPGEENHLIQDNSEDKESFNGRIVTMVNHIGHSSLQSFLYLPNNHQPFLGLGNNYFQRIQLQGNIKLDPEIVSFSEDDLNIYARSIPYYWYTWDGSISAKSYIPVSVTLLSISLGILITWKRFPKQVILLLAAMCAHILIWSFAGFSGNRFVKPIDWISLVFFGIGLSEFIGALIRILDPKEKYINHLRWFTQQRGEFSIISIHHKNVVQWLSVVLLVLIGISPAILEKVIPTQYTESKLTEKLTRIQSTFSKSPDLLEQCFPENESLKTNQILFGQALYPRYYDQGEILGNDRRYTVDTPAPPRIDFYNVGTKNIGVSLSNVTPALIFPHKTDVIVSGTIINERYVEARCVLLLEKEGNNGTITIINCNGESCLVEVEYYPFP